MPIIQSVCKFCGKEFQYPVMVKKKKVREICDSCSEKKAKYGEVLAVKPEIAKKRGYEGLWKGRGSWYRSKAFNKKDIATLLLGEKERKCIALRYNKFYKHGTDRPRFIFAFMDAREADKLVEEIPIQEPGWEREQMITVEDACSIALGAIKDAESGYSSDDLIVEVQRAMEQAAVDAVRVKQEGE